MHHCHVMISIHVQMFGMVAHMQVKWRTAHSAREFCIPEIVLLAVWVPTKKKTRCELKLFIF
jgi:hypothetical protein